MEKEITNPQMKVIVSDKEVQQKQDKLNAMRMALTYVEVRRLRVTPKETIKIAEEFLEWLVK